MEDSKPASQNPPTSTPRPKSSLCTITHHLQTKIGKNGKPEPDEEDSDASLEGLSDGAGGVIGPAGSYATATSAPAQAVGQKRPRAEGESAEEAADESAEDAKAEVPAEEEIPTYVPGTCLLFLYFPCYDLT